MRVLEYISQLVIIYSLVIYALETEPALEGNSFLFYSEIVVLGFFLVEYVIRIITAERKKEYLFSFYGIVDFLAIAPIILTFGLFDLRFTRIFRLLRLLRILKFAKYGKSTSILKDAFIEVKGELTIFTFLAMIVIYIASVGIYTFEHEMQPDNFKSIAQSMWWAVATLTTVGYGDVYPMTAAGKFFTAVILFVGLGIVAVPSGLLASALTNARKQKGSS